MKIQKVFLTLESHVPTCSGNLCPKTKVQKTGGRAPLKQSPWRGLATCPKRVLFRDARKFGASSQRAWKAFLRHFVFLERVSGRLLPVFAIKEIGRFRRSLFRLGTCATHSSHWPAISIPCSQFRLSRRRRGFGHSRVKTSGVAPRMTCPNGGSERRHFCPRRA